MKVNGRTLTNDWGCDKFRCALDFVTQNAFEAGARLRFVPRPPHPERPNLTKTAKTPTPGVREKPPTPVPILTAVYPPACQRGNASPQRLPGPDSYKPHDWISLSALLSGHVGFPHHHHLYRSGCTPEPCRGGVVLMVGILVFSFVINGISLVRMYAHVFLGHHRKSLFHPTPHTL